MTALFLLMIANGALLLFALAAIATLNTKLEELHRSLKDVREQLELEAEGDFLKEMERAAAMPPAASSSTSPLHATPSFQRR